MNLKLHLILTGFVLIVVFGMLMATGKLDGKKAPDSAPHNLADERFIQVISATWGKNCNAYLRNVAEEAKSENKKPPELVEENNALRIVSSLCNGKETCGFKVQPAVMGFDPAQRCRKKLNVQYRCFLTGLAKKATASDTQPLAIDCRMQNTRTPGSRATSIAD